MLYDTEDGLMKNELISGAAQSSILGPDIWNIFYDGILFTEMSKGTFLIGYVDDIAAVSDAAHLGNASSLAT